VESLSLVPHLLTDKDTYMSCGSGVSIGTKLISVAGNVNNPGVFEFPFGTTVREIIYGLAGGVQHDRKIQLIQFGGASGKVADSSVLDTPYTYDDLRAAGVMVGSGGLLVIDERTSVLDFLRMNQEFFSEESCGQCTPCREGNLHIKIILDKMAHGAATSEDIKTMGTIARVMSMSSLCGLGETAQNTLQSAMKTFPDVFALGGTNS
jgi:NADH-quinone oxidoreductase subunit F